MLFATRGSALLQLRTAAHARSSAAVRGRGSSIAAGATRDQLITKVRMRKICATLEPPNQDTL